MLVQQGYTDPSSKGAPLKPLLWPSLPHDLESAQLSVCDSFISSELSAALLARAQQLRPYMEAAKTGQGLSTQVQGVRGDKIQWLEFQDPVEKQLSAHLEALQTQLNRTLFLGLRDFEAHFAVYAPGQGYRRHLDRFKTDNSRVVSLVLYLTPDWKVEDKGALRAYLPSGPVDILPMQGRAVAFLSGDVEHEVLPPLRTRYSIAAWFKR